MEMKELSVLRTHRIDARAWSGSDTLLHVRLALRHLHRGEILEAICSEPELELDMRLMATHCCEEFLGVLPGYGYDRVFIRRASRTEGENARLSPPSKEVAALRAPAVPKDPSRIRSGPFSGRLVPLRTS